jgi:uncharacterized protein CbrC (UPF0167 family)
LLLSGHRRKHHSFAVSGSLPSNGYATASDRSFDIDVVRVACEASRATWGFAPGPRGCIWRVETQLSQSESEEVVSQSPLVEAWEAEQPLHCCKSLRSNAELVAKKVNKDAKTEAEGSTALEAVTRRQPLKIQQTEKT